MMLFLPICVCPAERQHLSGCGTRYPKIHVMWSRANRTYSSSQAIRRSVGYRSFCTLATRSRNRACTNLGGCICVFDPGVRP